MTTRSRTDRAAGTVLALEALLLLVVSAVLVQGGLPDPGAPGSAAQTHLWMVLLLNAIPAAVTAVAALVAAWWLWRGHRAARGLALGWAAVAGTASGLMLTSIGSPAWIFTVIVSEPGRWLVRWPFFYYDPSVGTNETGTPVEQLPGRLDSLLYWYPGLMFLGALTVAGLVGAGWVSRRRQVSGHPGPGGAPQPT